MDEKLWQILGSAIGGGGLVAIIAAIFKFRISRNTQQANIRKADFLGTSTVLDRQEKMIVAFQAQVKELLEAHVACLKGAARLQREIGSLHARAIKIGQGVQSPTAIITADAAGIVQGWNQAATDLFRWAKEEIIGQPITVLMPERFKVRHLAAFQAIVDANVPPRPLRTLTLHALTQDGEEISVTIRVFGWRENGEWRYAAEILQDDSDHKDTGG